MSDPLSNFCGTHWERGKVKVKRVATESRSQDTLIKIELVVSDGYTLSTILRDLDDAKHPPKKEAPPRRRSAEPPAPLALPAPPLQLGFRGHDI